MKTERISETFQQSAQVKLQFAKQYDTTIAEVSKRRVAALKKGHKLLFFGNGGSACDATHLAAELVNRFNRNRPTLAAISLATDTAALTSIRKVEKVDRLSPF